MKKIFYCFVVAMLLAACSKEDENQNVWENIITSMGQSQLSAMDVMASADCWSTKIIYQYTEAGGKGDSKKYYDSNQVLEGASRSCSYGVKDGNLYEYRSHPVYGNPYYYTYALSGSGNNFSLVRRHDGRGKTMSIVAYDDNSMILEFYNPTNKSYPYSREYVVRWSPDDYFWEVLTAYEDLPEDKRP